jgi:hypothetical protein
MSVASDYKSKTRAALHRDWDGTGNYLKCFGIPGGDEEGSFRLSLIIFERKNTGVNRFRHAGAY